MEYMSKRAAEVIREARVIVGYKTYIELIGELLKDKKVISTGMLGEMERVNLALDEALSGNKVALISGGDSGVYGMAGLVFSMAISRNIDVSWMRDGSKGKPDILLEVVPGITSLTAAASLLGAPLMHDFASISLSDLLTPWEIIQKRVENAAQGDFVIALHNPVSKKRNWQLSLVREILLKFRKPETPVGVVSSAMRKQQKIMLSTLADMEGCDMDMQTVIIIGNSATFRHGDFMITPRGYLEKYG